MKKLFTSNVAFIAFVILFTTFLLTVYKDPFARVMWSLSIGGLIGFVFAQWYWKDKMDKIKHLIDARMSSPDADEFLKRKEEELFEAANRNLKLVDRIGELQNELTALKESYNIVSDERDVYANLVFTARQAKYAAPISELKEKGE